MLRLLVDFHELVFAEDEIERGPEVLVVAGVRAGAVEKLVERTFGEDRLERPNLAVLLGQKLPGLADNAFSLGPNHSRRGQTRELLAKNLENFLAGNHRPLGALAGASR